MHKNRIKNLKPDPNSKFKNGYFDIENSTKYSGEGPVIYRSGLELKFFSLFERSDIYTSWESEPDLNIKYFFDKRLRPYYIDAMFTHKEHGIYLIEIKPFAQSVAPEMGKNEVSFRRQKYTYEQNIAKWTAAKKYAESKGYKFAILTEKFFN